MKAPTGITGFDDVTGGGLPRGRPTLIAGGAGAGKTLFGVEFLVRGAKEYGEPGVMFAFEEAQEDIAVNVASLGFDIPQLCRDGLLAVETVRVDPTDLSDAGEFDLEGLFVRLAAAVQSVGAKRVVLDSLEVLFGALPDSTLRAELGRLFRWLKSHDLTAVITAERAADGSLTRFGMEEYISDCVVVLDHRVNEEVSTRRLRVVKYRGSLHGTNEYPFLIAETGLSVVPITAVDLDYPASEDRMPTGIPRFDEMLGGGLIRGAVMMISGSAGTGKTSIAAHIADEACRRGERVAFLSFEESPAQLARNMRSIGIDLEQWQANGALVLRAMRATAAGLEEHLALVHRLLQETEPSLLVMDAVGNLSASRQDHEASSAIARVQDLVKSHGVTAVMSSLTAVTVDTPEVAVSSLVDTWVSLRNHEHNGERTRLMYIIKSRGTPHSNQVREFVLTDDGAQIVDVYVGPDGVLTGSARAEQVLREQAAQAARARSSERRRLEFARRSAEIEAKIAALQTTLELETSDFEQATTEAAEAEAREADARAELAMRRGGGAAVDDPQDPNPSDEPDRARV